MLATDTSISCDTSVGDAQKKKRWEADRLVQVFFRCTNPNHMGNAWEGIYNPPEASDGSPLGVIIEGETIISQDEFVNL